MERQEVCADLCRRIIAEGGYDGISAEAIALTLEGFFDGPWLNILMCPARFSRRQARAQILG